MGKTIITGVEKRVLMHASAHLAGDGRQQPVRAHRELLPSVPILALRHKRDSAMLRWAVRRRRRRRRWSRRRWRRRWRACRRIARDRRVDDWVQPGERRHLSCHLSHTLVALGVETRLRGARAEREGDACDGERGLALVAAVCGPRAWSRLPNQAFLCQKPWALPQPTRSWVHTQSEAKSSTTVWSRKTCAHTA